MTMKLFSKGAVFCFMIALMIFSAVSVYAAAGKSSTVTSPETKTKKAEAASDQSALSGKVVETMNSGGYTYVRLEKKGKKTWVAMPDTKVAVGQQISLQPGIEMVNFTSKSLGKTFDSIIFSGGLASAAPSSGNTGHMVKKSENGKTASPPIKVSKATGPDAYTVGEIFEKRTALHEKTAVVKAKVVKFSAGIMGKNWIHLEDGTGDPQKGTSDLVATTNETATFGEIITVKGTVFKDRDFGAGYKYAVIIENASIQR